MRKFLYRFCILLLLTSLFSCAKKENNNAPSLPRQEKNWAMGATIGGVAWQTDSVISSTNKDTFSGVTFLVIGGATKGDSAIAIGIEDGTGPGNYNLSNGSSYNLSFVSGGAQYTCTSGTLYIGTNANKVISGIFNGTVTEVAGAKVGSSISIVNGHFRVAY